MQLAIKSHTMLCSLFKSHIGISQVINISLKLTLMTDKKQTKKKNNNQLNENSPEYSIY